MDDFILYKTELKKWYHHVKDGVDSRFLLMPAQAKLRNLCIQICRNGNHQDLISFRNFLGFDFDPDAMNRIKGKTEDFKKIARFLKDKSVLADPEPVEMLAVLIGFPYRPYQKFIENKDKLEDLYTAGFAETRIPALDEKTGVGSEEDKNVEENYAAQEKEEKNEVKEKEPKYVPIVILSDDAKAQNPEQVSATDRSWWERNRVKVLSIAGVIILLGTALYGYIPNDDNLQCMQWQTTHYEKVKCEARQGIGNPINPIDTAQFKVRRIPVSKSTIFFIKGKAIVWYSRNNGYEFYDHPGYHPLLGKEKELKEVSTGIAESVRNGTIKPNY